MTEVTDKSDILDCGGPGRDGVPELSASERELTDKSDILCCSDVRRGDNGGNPSGVSLKSKPDQRKTTNSDYSRGGLIEGRVLFEEIWYAR